MSKINREGTVNVIEWIEAEEKEKIHKSEKDKLSTEILKLRMEKDKQNSIALYEMYNAVARCGENHYCSDYTKKLCYYAEAMVHLCFKLKHIDRETYKRLTDYLDCRIKHC